MEETEVKDRILKGAEELFRRYGVRSITMDEIARHLGISKKTIYQYFSDKDDVVCSVTLAHLQIHHKEFEQVAEESKNSVEELVRLSLCLKENLKDMNAAVLFDLQRYHQKAWSMWIDFKRKVIKESVVRNLKKGIVDGYFRKEIDPEILSIMRLEMIQMGFDDQLFPRDRYSLAEVQLNLLEHFIHGLLTDKGRKLYNKYKETITEHSITNY